MRGRGRLVLGRLEVATAFLSTESDKRGLLAPCIPAAADLPDLSVHAALVKHRAERTRRGEHAEEQEKG